MTVTDGMYLIRNYAFLHPLVPDPIQNVTIEPFNGPYEIKEEALWRIGVLSSDLKNLKDDSLYITSVYHGALHHLTPSSPPEGALCAKKYKKEESVPPWKISRLNDSGYYTVESVEPSAIKRITGVKGGVVLKSLSTEDSREKNFSQGWEWDIQFMKENCFAFRNRRFGQYLSAGKEISNDSAPVSLDDSGIPRRFIWEIAPIAGHYSLRNLEKNFFLHIHSDSSPLVEWKENDSLELSQWTFNPDVEPVFSIVNRRISSYLLEITEINKKAVLETKQTANEENKYSIILNPKDSLSNLPKQALWKLEFVGPYMSFVEPDLIPSKSYSMIKEGKAIQPIVEAVESRSETYAWIDRKLRTINGIYKVEITYGTPDNEWGEVPNRGLYCLLDHSVASLQKKDKSRQREIATIANRLSQVQQSLTDSLEHKFTHLQQEYINGLIKLKKEMPNLVISDLAKNIEKTLDTLENKLDKEIEQALEKALVPIRNDIALVRAKIDLQSNSKSN